MTVVDADGVIMGRLASSVAKRLLGGEQITIINAEKAIITGTREDILGRFKARRSRGKPSRWR